jgi:hypothetical protein
LLVDRKASRSMTTTILETFEAIVAGQIVRDVSGCRERMTSV